MKVQRSNVQGVKLIGPEDASFLCAVATLLGREPDDVVRPALPYSVLVENTGPLSLALLGIRFDMLGPELKPYSVIHYADTLRNPEKSDLKPGCMRFVCAEPLYTDLVLRRADGVHPRGPLNLANLGRALQCSASIDCAAFEDGAFYGPDKRRAFERFALESIAESRLIEELLRPGCAVLPLLQSASEIPADATHDRALVARRLLARRLAECLYQGGIEEALAMARNHKFRIPLHRAG